MDAEYTIYVTNLPIELNEDGIRDIFSQYGKIKEMFYPRNATWAYVTYGTYREAELAMRELHEKRPLCLKVALAKDKSTKEEVYFEKPKVINTTDSPSPIYSDLKYQSMGRGQSTHVFRKHVMPHLTVPTNFANCGSLSSLPSCLQTHDIYEMEDPYMSSNKLWTRGVVTVTPDGKRHVSLGRGYTLYEYPESYPKIEDCILKVYQQRKNGLYEYSKDKFKNEVQNCSVCSTKTTTHCEKCCTYYCSKACQLEDWPQHQAKCERIPALVEEVDISSLQINQDTNQIKRTSTPNVEKIAKTGDVKLRRPNTFNMMKVENSNNTSANINEHKTNIEVTCNFIDRNQHNHNYRNNSKTTDFKERYDNSNIRDRTSNNDRNFPPQRNSFQNNKGSADYNDRENTSRQGNFSSNTSVCVNNDLAFYKDTQLSKTKFLAVQVIISLDNDEYWICKLEDIDARTNLMMNLQDVAKKSRNVQPIIGEVYGVLYETIWQRAIITSLNPTKVHFIDFGNDEILEKNSEIKDIGDLIKFPKFARKIRLAQGTSDKYRNLQSGEKISVKMLSKNYDKTIVVDVEEEQSTAENLSSHTESASNGAKKKFVPQKNVDILPNNKSTNASTMIQQIPSVLDALADLRQHNSELQINAFIQIFESTQKNVYNATFFPQVFSTEIKMVLEDIQDECSKIQVLADYIPKVGELVCGKWDGSWYRGYISTHPQSIFAIDETRILQVTEIVPCPKKYSNICAFGVICEINSTVKLEMDSSYECTSISSEKSSKQSLEIQMHVNSEVIQAVLKTWKLTNSSNLFELKSGSKICLTSYRNYYYMFARSLEEADVEHYNNVMQSVAQYAQTAPNLTEPPLDGEIVIAPFEEDGNSYRAMVLKKTQNNKVKIVYIDFGNITEIDTKNLKVMPCHSQQQSCAVKVILKDVPRDVPMNQDVDMYLRHLSGTEVPLVCTFESSAKDGVRLTILDTGECVNDKINQLLIPGWKKENNDDNTCYMLNNIKTAILGRVGETVNAMVVYQREDVTSYMMGPLDVDLITHLEEMPKMLKEYAEKNDYYLPRKEELCVALYDGAWYRAACLNPKKSYMTAEIFFIDYGNIEIVEHKNIRLMPKDFILPEAFASICSVVNLAPIDGNGKYSEAVQNKLKELVVDNTPIKIKIVQSDDGCYEIELPEIRAALIEHGLL
ncbi:hypothetical protein ALC62_14896 [Cyphomyrmex costatus]|uniref:Tudor domain-containing protein 1 n=1 Tax=Cyphomyrmex costatus TaxID=456900 RepID=A0A195C2N6_9HYME|nr:hypothetical protein ALC62_14896 [Cyphomyrmex costatus]